MSLSICQIPSLFNFNLINIFRKSSVFFRQGDGSARWYKFDDGEVTECKMDDEEEMKTQCFGGDYMGEV